MDEQLYSIDLTYDDVKLLLYSVEKGIERWAGGDPEEQDRLLQMRDSLRAMVLEHTFYNM